jgi:hypothetical protein
MCLAIAFGVVAASRFPKPSLMQEFRTQLADRRMLIDFDVAEKTKTLTYGAGCAEFADGESHRLSVSVGPETRIADGIISLRGTHKLMFVKNRHAFYKILKTGYLGWLRSAQPSPKY